MQLAFIVWLQLSTAYVVANLGVGVPEAQRTRRLPITWFRDLGALDLTLCL
ncbi:MAG: hypothetical protein K6U80_01630 [Firmicutes bacterium]|nr:hypothetical protein [Bacillota bacterium]